MPISLDVIAAVLSGLCSTFMGVGAYVYRKHQSRLEKLESNKVDRDLLDIELRNMKDDVREIKENVEYIRRKVENK